MYVLDWRFIFFIVMMRRPFLARVDSGSKHTSAALTINENYDSGKLDHVNKPYNK
jgi:hypothetical protein